MPTDPASPAIQRDDLYHCFLETLSQAEINDDSIACDLNTYQWIIEELNPDRPPTRCEGLNLLTLGGDNANDDGLEPCVLWELQYGLLAKSNAPSGAPTLDGTFADTFVESLADTFAESLADTFADSLADSLAESLLGSNSGTQIPSGGPSGSPSRSTGPSLAPSGQPSETPSLRPSDAPSESVGPSLTPSGIPSNTRSALPSSIPSYFPSNSPSTFVLEKKPSIKLSGVSLSFFIAPGNSTRTLRRRLQTEIDPEALLEVIQLHVKTYLLDALDLELLAVVFTIAYSVSVSEEVTLARLDGNVYFKEDDVAPTDDTMDILVSAAFKGTALNELLLAFANHEQLSSIKAVEFENEADAVAAILAQTRSNEKEPTFTTSRIIILAGAGAGLVSLGIFTYLLLLNRTDSARHGNIIKNDTGLTSPRTIDPENGQDFPDVHSDTTSVYSYIKDESSLSMAPSYMYALNKMNDSDDDDSLIVPAWGSLNGSPDRSGFSSVRHTIIDSNPSSPSKSSYVLTDDEHSSMDADLELVLGVERQPVRNINGLWQNGPKGKEIMYETIRADVSPPGEHAVDSPHRVQTETDMPQSVSPIRVAEDTRDWKVKYGIPDEQELVFIPDDRQNHSLAGMSNIDEVTVETEEGYVVPEYLFQTEYNSDDEETYESEEATEKLFPKGEIGAQEDEHLDDSNDMSLYDDKTEDSCDVSLEVENYTREDVNSCDVSLNAEKYAGEDVNSCDVSSEVENFIGKDINSCDVSSDVEKFVGEDINSCGVSSEVEKCVGEDIKCCDVNSEVEKCVDEDINSCDVSLEVEKCIGEDINSCDVSSDVEKCVGEDILEISMDESTVDGSVFEGKTATMRSF